MNELWIINDQVVHEGERLYHKGGYPKSEWNFVFYDKETGEVYGQRIVTDQELPWLYRPGPKPMLNFIFEELESPDGAFEYYVNYLYRSIENDQNNERTLCPQELQSA